MTAIKFRGILQKKSAALLASAASGIITSLAFSVERLWFLVFFSFIPLFLAILVPEKLSRRKTLSLVFVFTASYYITLLSWMFKLNNVVAIAIGNYSEIAIVLIMTFISLVMGLFMILAFIPYSAVRQGNMNDVFIFSFLFILGEWIQGVLPALSFPWGRIGVIASPFISFIQSSSLFGTLFISLIIVMINGLLAFWFINIKNFTPLFVLIGILSSNILYGIVRQNNLENNTAPEKSALLLQGNYSGLEKWESDSNEVLETYLRLARENLDESISMIIMPESAIPIDFYARTDTQKILSEFANENDLTIIMGILNKSEDIRYNSMIAIYPDGKISKPYNKQRLVPVGEYLPHSNIISKIHPKIPDVIGFYSPGMEAGAIKTPDGKVGGVICYESIYPEVARKNVAFGAEVLAVVSNDSWFNNSPALRQHHAHSIMRAVENNRYVLRSSSTAITSVISPWGKVEKTAPILEPAAIKVNYEMRNAKTLYTLIGDLIILPSLLVYISPIIFKVRKIFKK